MNLIEKIRKVLSEPSRFFEEIKREVGITEAFKYSIILSVVYTILYSLLNLSISYLAYPSFIPLFSGFVGFSFIRISFIFAGLIISPFIGAGFLHLFVKMFGGKNNYEATYRVVVYSSTPSLLIGWIPLVGFIGAPYGWYLSVKGLSLLHNISMGRAFLSTIIPIFLIAILVGGLAFLYISSIYRTAVIP